MNRKEFIKTCGYACLGTGTFATLLQSCVGGKTISSEILGDDIIVPLIDFERSSDGENTYRKYIVIQNELLQFPIYVYRFSVMEYTALYMQCSHQGNELSAYGDKLVCSAHGSEFDNKGNVTSSPADSPLRSFPVKVGNEFLQISLKKV
jgi:Rieske Fe-S protein